MSGPTITATSNAQQVSAFFIERADGVRLYGAAASATLAKLVKDAVTPLLRDETPQKTGDLAKSQDAVTKIVPGGADITWSSDLPYAPFVLHGTGIYATPDPHQEWDVDGYQAFQVAGGMVYAQHTHHKGQHPDDWPDRTVQRAEPAINAALALVDGRLMAVFR